MFSDGQGASMSDLRCHIIILSVRESTLIFEYAIHLHSLLFSLLVIAFCRCTRAIVVWCAWVGVREIQMRLISLVVEFGSS